MKQETLKKETCPLCKHTDYKTLFFAGSVKHCRQCNGYYDAKTEKPMEAYDVIKDKEDKKDSNSICPKCGGSKTSKVLGQSEKRYCRECDVYYDIYTRLFYYKEDKEDKKKKSFIPPELSGTLVIDDSLPRPTAEETTEVFKLLDASKTKHFSTEIQKQYDAVNNPSHYTGHPSGIECIEITRYMNFNLGNAMKYIWRAGLKSKGKEIEDLRKAIWYLNDEIEKIQRPHIK